MKKLLALLIISVFGLALISCSGTTISTLITTGSSTTGTDNTGETTTISHDPVTITYAAWNLGTVDSLNLERLMIEAFMEEYPWITVEIIERPKVTDPSGTSEIDQNWNEFLGARAAQGTLPDVYFTDSTETTIMNNWAKDVTTIAHNDPEFMNISEDIREAANYGGKLMALPYAVYYFGYYINKTLFDDYNADYPVFEDTFDEFMDKVGDVANQTVTNGTGVAGIVGINRMLEWYPAQLNPDLGWYTYDGEQLNLNGSEFETTLNLYQSLMQDKTLIYDAMTPEEQLAAFGTTNTWESSQLAAYFEYTPIIGSMVNYDFDIDFIGTPGTDAAHQIPVVLDLMCVASTTQHLNEAYLLAKWMSFGKDGYLKRIELSTTVEGINPLNMTPLQPDADLLDAFFNIYPTFTEFRKVVEYGDYIIEPNKYVPGYIKARWNADYDAERTVGQMFDLVASGQVNYADVKEQWNSIANNALALARQSVFDKLGVSETQ
ncbi:MAG: carbohydrate ABC transporter substrate-binding protein [Bacilli bacterium]|nr:carbohydrate ABC transporter substrate-binding protein [Bacilli bacterium]MBN2876316.1 carbohydrate ABC transporter substrate-binding protein [Bacilli bacterium]